MKILITGAGGQIGPDLVAVLKGRGHEIVATDVAVRPDVVDCDAWHHLDVTDRNAVFSLFRQVNPERVFHLAAVLSARGEEVPQQTYAVNQTGTFNILEACRETGVGQLMFTSSIAVYGPGTPDPTPDRVVLEPTTMYGVTKVGGELLGAYYYKRYGFDFRAVRFPGLISASLPGGGTSDYALFMYVDGIRHGAYESFCRPDSKIPFMYMPDAIRAMLELADAPKENLKRSIYNIAAIHPTAEEVADAVRARVSGVNLTFRPDPARQAILDSWPQVLDDSNARNEWGWNHEYDLERMSDDLIEKLRVTLEVA